MNNNEKRALQILFSCLKDINSLVINLVSKSYKIFDEFP